VALPLPLPTACPAGARTPGGVPRQHQCLARTRTDSGYESDPAWQRPGRDHRDRQLTRTQSRANDSQWTPSLYRSGSAGPQESLSISAAGPGFKFAAPAVDPCRASDSNRQSHVRSQTSAPDQDFCF
jgi:hypothetical protein